MVVSKSRLSPQDETPIPHLELLAAMLAVNIDCTSRREMKIPLKPSMLWSESLIVLQSLANERKRFPLFVSRRLLLITKHSCIDDWNYVPTKLNPADILSRGSRADIIAKNHEWFEGPQFLNNNPSCWPVCCKKGELSADEIKCFDKKHVNACLVKNELLAVDKLIAHYSSWTRLKKAAAWLIRFKCYDLLHRSIAKVAKGHLTVSELQASERHLIIYEQQQAFGHFISRVPEGLNVYASSVPAALRKLNPIVIQGTLRVGRRLDKALLTMTPAIQSP